MVHESFPGYSVKYKNNNDRNAFFLAGLSIRYQGNFLTIPHGFLNFIIND
jgi:hypothetical protein